MTAPDQPDHADNDRPAGKVASQGHATDGAEDTFDDSLEEYAEDDEADEPDAETENAPVGTRRRRRRRPPAERKKLGTILEEIALDTTRTRVSVEDLLRAMDGRAFGALLLIFAFPNALPTPPGTSGILGLPLLYLSAQMMLGRPPWLPRLIAVRSMAHADFGSLVEKVNPWLIWADKFMAPRFQLLVSPQAERLLGAFILVLATVLVLPIPLGNMLPAFAICLIALGVLEKDGLWVLAGIGVGVSALMIVATVVWALFRAIFFLVFNAF
jgi:hypothetical protein